MTRDLNKLKDQVQESVNEHNRYQSLDGFYYNIGVVAAIAGAAAAAIATDYSPLIAKILASFVAIVVAVNFPKNFKTPSIIFFLGSKTLRRGLTLKKSIASKRKLRTCDLYFTSKSIRLFEPQSVAISHGSTT